MMVVPAQKMSELFVKGRIGRGICCPNWNNNFDMNNININIEIILNINMYRAVSGFLSLYVWQLEINSFTERDTAAKPTNDDHWLLL